MISLKSNRRTIPALVSFALLFGSLLPFRSHAEGRDPAKATVIRETPPAPRIDQNDRLAELASRRARVAQSIGAKAVLILFSGEPRVYTNDVDYQFRQENNLYYLTNLKQVGST